MCQSHQLTLCSTIKANAHLRRSCQWNNQSKDANIEQIAIDTLSNNSERDILKNKSRRKRRPTKRQTQQHSDSCDVSTTSTAATSPSADESLSDVSLSATDSNKQSIKRTSNQRRRSRKRFNKSRSSRINKVVHISAPNLTEEEKTRYVALDCEMVGIGPGGYQSRLARVCLVNWDGDIIYDAHVEVAEKVTDYRTFVSGITEEDLLSDDAVTFDEAQFAVASLLRGKILVGHGLMNDFRVLALSHPWHAIRDTAKYEPFMRPVDPADPYNVRGVTHVPKKLKVLAQDKLGMVIQEEGQPHSPKDDAVAALELYKKHRGKWEKAVEWKVEKTRALITVC